MVSRREVLIEHDRKIVAQLREAVANARELGELSAATAHQLLVGAANDAQSLRGKHAALDRILERLRALGAMATTANNHTLIGWLEEATDLSGS